MNHQGVLCGRRLARELAIDLTDGGLAIVAPTSTTDDALDESACVADRGAGDLTDVDLDDAASVVAMCGDGKYVFCIACECVDDLAGDPMCNGPCENLVEADEAELVWCDDGGLIGSGSAVSDGGLPLPPV